MKKNRYEILGNTAKIEIYKYIKYKPLYLSKPVFRGNLQH